MNVTVKLAAFGGALALLGAGAFAVGNAVGPVEAAQPSKMEEHAGMPVPELPGGLASSMDGYTLEPALNQGKFTFRIAGPDGGPVTNYDVEQEKRLHLIVVRRDTTGFRHLHPELAPDGTWSVPLLLSEGGSYRAIADFIPTGGRPIALGVDLDAPGEYRPVKHQPSRVARVDGYTVELTGDLVPGHVSPLSASVSRDGEPVTDLQPYLGALGHLVVLREGDLAYLHVHPEAGTRFGAEVPSAGQYRLFLQFRHAETVHTAEFTLAT